MSSKSSGGAKRPPKRILPKENPNDVIYFMSQIDESSINSLDHRLIVPKVEIQESEPVYQIIEQSTVDVALEDDETEGEYTETITIISDTAHNDDEKNLVEGHVVYVREDECDDEAEDSVTFMQVGGPDVASEETIETSMIIEIPPEDNSEPKSSSHLSSDHCYTFKKGIRPRDLDRVKARAAMMGDNGDLQSISQQPYAFILPKQLEAPIKKISQKSFESKRSEFRRATVKETKGGKHRWLWQFMKELLFIGDPCLKWYNQKEGTFLLFDQDQLAIKWECYKQLNCMKAQVWRQMRYYFGWMEENKILRQVPETEHTYQFVERFYREKFLPYKFKPHTNVKQLNEMAKEMREGVASVLSRYKNGCKEKVYCSHGCGSQFINKDACERHESVCSFELN